jgi:hypothetical protein
MDIRLCPNCNRRVAFSATGECPSCRRISIAPSATGAADLIEPGSSYSPEIVSSGRIPAEKTPNDPGLAPTPNPNPYASPLAESAIEVQRVAELTVANRKSNRQARGIDFVVAAICVIAIGKQLEDFGQLTQALAAASFLLMYYFLTKMVFGRTLGQFIAQFSPF